MEFKLTTPVVLIVYKRPLHTQKVFEKIAKARPTKLYLIADGPKDKPDDAEKCDAVRKVIKKVDWPCEVERVYADKNMGSKYRVSSGLDYVFSKEEEAIILEDDCLPDQSFFRYCQELLEKFWKQEQVFMISGHNPLGRYKHKELSYFFGVQGTWGWATWKRAWQHFEVELPKFKQPEYRNIMHDFLQHNEKLIHDLERGCQLMFEEGVDAWDYQWQYTCAINRGLTVFPTKNLIQNIGFGQEATHTTNEEHALGKTKTKSLRFPLRHNTEMIADIDFNNKVYEHVRGGYIQKIMRLFKKKN